MILAAAAYPLSSLVDFAEYANKLTIWVEDAVAAGAHLLVFPEYGSMELASLAPREVSEDLEAPCTKSPAMALPSMPCTANSPPNTISTSSALRPRFLAINAPPTA